MKKIQLLFTFFFYNTIHLRLSVWFSMGEIRACKSVIAYLAFDLVWVCSKTMDSLIGLKFSS